MSSVPLSQLYKVCHVKAVTHVGHPVAVTGYCMCMLRAVAVECCVCLQMGSKLMHKDELLSSISHELSETQHKLHAVQAELAAAHAQLAAQQQDAATQADSSKSERQELQEQLQQAQQQLAVAKEQNEEVSSNTLQRRMSISITQRCLRQPARHISSVNVPLNPWHTVPACSCLHCALLAHAIIRLHVLLQPRIAAGCSAGHAAD